MRRINFGHNMNNVQKAFDKIANERRLGMYGIAKTMIFSTLTFVVIKSPVETGRYRGAHVVEEGEPPALIDTNMAMAEAIRSPSQVISSAKKALDDILSEVPKNKKSTKLYIMNPVPWSHAIERGHSGQAPNGVYKIARKRAVKIWKKATR